MVVMVAQPGIRNEAIGMALRPGVTGSDLLGDDPEWQTRALCSQSYPDAFFPEKGAAHAKLNVFAAAAS